MIRIETHQITCSIPLIRAFIVLQMPYTNPRNFKYCYDGAVNVKSLNLVINCDRPCLPPSLQLQSQQWYCYYFGSFDFNGKDVARMVILDDASGTEGGDARRIQMHWSSFFFFFASFSSSFLFLLLSLFFLDFMAVSNHHERALPPPIMLECGPELSIPLPKTN